MSVSINFKKANVLSISLAKVGNAQRGEPLKTSRDLCQFEAEDNEMLTHAFLKPFRNLERYSFDHHSDINLNEMYGYADSIFSQQERFLAFSRKIARHLYDKSRHPNIKSGDLCIALIGNVYINKLPCTAVSIVKSESLVPFLEISDKEGDLQLTTHNGIYPDKIDKGALLVDFQKDDGFLVYTFDKGGSDTNFWVKEFLGAKPQKDDEYKTKQYAEMCASFAKEGLPEDLGEEDRFRIANQATQYFSEKEQFEPESFQQEVLKDPDRIEAFRSYKENYKDDEGQPLEEEFQISSPAAKKAMGKLKSAVKLDSGVLLRFTPDFVDHPDSIERGFDEARGQKFIKLYYEEEM